MAEAEDSSRSLLVAQLTEHCSMYRFSKGVCFYRTRLSLTGPSIRNWTSFRRGAATLLAVRERGGAGVGREQFSEFVYLQLNDEEHSAWNLIESDSIF